MHFTTKQTDHLLEPIHLWIKIPRYSFWCKIILHIHSWNADCLRRLNLLKTLAHTRWGGRWTNSHQNIPKPNLFKTWLWFSSVRFSITNTTTQIRHNTKYSLKICPWSLQDRFSSWSSWITTTSPTWSNTYLAQNQSHSNTNPPTPWLNNKYLLPT